MVSEYWSGGCSGLSKELWPLEMAGNWHSYPLVNPVNQKTTCCFEGQALCPPQCGAQKVPLSVATSVLTASIYWQLYILGNVKEKMVVSRGCLFPVLWSSPAPEQKLSPFCLTVRLHIWKVGEVGTYKALGYRLLQTTFVCLLDNGVIKKTKKQT